LSQPNAASSTGYLHGRRPAISVANDVPLPKRAAETRAIAQRRAAQMITGVGLYLDNNSPMLPENNSLKPKHNKFLCTMRLLRPSGNADFYCRFTCPP
jgi:hypothetical protein